MNKKNQQQLRDIYGYKYIILPWGLEEYMYPLLLVAAFAVQLS